MKLGDLKMLSDDQAYMKSQIQDNLRLKDTDELLEIWRSADHEEWTDLAFEVVREILTERLGEIPAPPAAEEDDATVETRQKTPERAPTAQEIRKFQRQQTYEAMDEMDTDELIEIWQEADREEWTDLAFNVVQQILLERIGEVPAREPSEALAAQHAAPPDKPEPAPRVTLEFNPPGEDAELFDVTFNLVALRCPDCGKSIDEEDRVCPHCGVDLEAPLSEAQLSTLAVEQLEKAQLLYDQGRDFKGALVECNLALDYAPHSAPIHNLRGLILDALGKTGLAVQEYTEALRLDPDLSEARDNLADAEAELKARKA
jgi:tetratricopeptide (TPR) repeat protein